ncbi:hypothetical protein S245_038002 [Arachis hypogaea]
MDRDVEGGGVWGYTELKGIIKDLFGEVNGVGGMRVAANEGGDEGVAGEEVGFNAEVLHLVEELEGEVGVVREGVGREGGVEEWLRETGAAEEELVEGVAGVVGGDEVEEEGAGGGVEAVDEEAGEEGEEGLRGVEREGWGEWQKMWKKERRVAEWVRWSWVEERTESTVGRVGFWIKSLSAEWGSGWLVRMVVIVFSS